MTALLTRRRWLATTTLTLAAGTARAQRPLLRAGDQKGGLRALLDAAGELDSLAYDIKWAEFPAAAPLAEALNGDAVALVRSTCAGVLGVARPHHRHRARGGAAAV